MRNNRVDTVELGRIWMRNSVNIGHDYVHAKEVETHALKVYRELKDAQKLPSYIDEDAVRLAAWWHDCYKARLKRSTFYALFFEGREASKIARKELNAYVKGKKLEAVIEAIKRHNNFILSFFLTKNYPPLLQILMEADSIEAFSVERFERMYSGIDRAVVRPIFLFNLYSTIVWFKLLPKSQYMRKFLDNFKYSSIR